MALKIGQVFMIVKLNKIKKVNNISNIKLANLLLLFFLPLNVNAELWAVQNTAPQTKVTFLNNSHNVISGKINEFGVYRKHLRSNKADNGFFLHDNISMALGSFGVDLLDSNIKQQSDWAIKDRGLAGYGYRYNDDAALLLGLNLPNSHIQDSAYISFTIGRSW